MKFIKEHGGYVIGLVAIGFFLYAFNLHNPLFWDDADWILNNPSVHALTWDNIKFIFTHDALAGIGQVSNYYRPFLFLTFLGNYLVSGVSPISYHLVSNFIHLANALLIFYLVSRWLKNIRAAFLATLIFLIHPLQTEAVAYVSGRGDPLSVFFMLGGILLWVKGRRWWAAASAILAVLSRETAVLFPAYLALVIIAFEARGSLWQRCKIALGAAWPYIGISVAYGVMRLTILNFQNTLNFYQQANIYSTHLAVRVYTFLSVLLVYIKIIFWPTGLHMDRDIPVNLSPWMGSAWLGALVILVIIATLVWLYCHRSPQFNAWLFGTGLFFGALSPTMGLVPINARIYEHWLYFSIAGFAMLMGFYVDKILVFIENTKRTFLPFFVILMVGYFGFLGIQTIRRNLLWGDTEAFYKNILAYEPHDVRVLNNLGNWYSDHNNPAAAMPLYQQAIEVEPTQPAPYHNIGNILRDAGDTAGAIQWYQKSIMADPRFHYAYDNIAAIYYSQNKIDEAAAILEKLQEVSPSDINAQRIKFLKDQL